MPRRHKDNDSDDGDVELNGLSTENGHHMNIISDSEDEERDSLLRETADHSPLAARHALRFRHNRENAVSNGNNGDNNDDTTTILGVLRHSLTGRFTCHSVALLSALAVVLLVPLVIWNWDLEHESMVDEVRKPPHQPSFGGGLNPGYNNNNNDDDNDDSYYYYFDEDTEEFPTSNVGRAVVSTTKTNRDNWPGHFWHDPFVSPYASPFYAVSDESVATKRQEAFNKTREQMIQKFGFFDPPPFEKLERPDFSNIPHRDLPLESFRPQHWQSDAAYLKLWLAEGQALVTRVRDAIYEEYGYNDTSTAELREERDLYFRVILRPDTIVQKGAAYDADDLTTPINGVAYMPPTAWKGLIRKLLHAMMTHDDFYAVVVGQAHTYGGNNFGESQIQQFNRIMEPVLDKLGVRLISRNMGMDASTTISALGGADIYGEADILWYIPDTRDGVQMESRGQFDLLHKQAILSGERMPLILTPQQANLLTSTGGKAWVGNVQPGTAVCDETRVRVAGGVIVPPVEACKYVRCNAAAERKRVCRKYHSKCWEKRSDWNPGEKDEKDTHQDEDTGDTAKGYPNVQVHRWEGRKLAVMVLTALSEALELWAQQTLEGNVPLPTSYWHVGDVYEELRESVRTLERKPGEAADVPDCEYLLRHLNPMICHMAMHAYTEWTPRVNPLYNRITNITDSIGTNRKDYLELYDEVDIRPFQWKVPDGNIDVHMVALATTTRANNDVSLGSYQKRKKTPFHCPDDDLFGNDDGRWLVSEQQQEERSLTASDNNWIVHDAPLGFCDGSAQSRCNRAVGNTCLIANYNHYKVGISAPVVPGSSTRDSGWLYLTLRGIKEGVILLRFDKELNDSTLFFDFEFSINGKVEKWDKFKFVKSAVKIVDDLVVHPLLMDKDQTFEEAKIGLRASGPGSDKLVLSHIYYA